MSGCICEVPRGALLPGSTRPLTFRSELCVETVLKRWSLTHASSSRGKRPGIAKRAARDSCGKIQGAEILGSKFELEAPAVAASSQAPGHVDVLNKRQFAKSVWPDVEMRGA